MPKKPFSIRVEQVTVDKYRAMATILQQDSSRLLAELLADKEKILTKEQKQAYESLLTLWKKDT